MSKPAINKLSFFLAIPLSLWMASVSTALESDKVQELEFSADGDSRMSTAEGTRIIEMSNNVIITQGSLRISGDEATIKYNIATSEVSKVIVTGNPARYQQQPGSTDGLAKGSSKTITLYTDESDGSDIVELTGEAVIESSDSNFACHSIVYIADQDLIREAAGPCSGVFNSPTE